MKKVILIGLGSIFALIVIVILYAQLTWDGKTFDAPYPDITASTDPEVIERGRYLAFGPAHCSTCHVPMDKIMDVENGEVIPLSGGWELTLPLGTFRAPNITPDMETGIGKLTDAEIARTLRHSVGNDGRLIFPFMPFQHLSDEDLTAIVSFLRSQPPVKHEMKRTEYSFLGRIIGTLMGMEPVQPTIEIPKAVKREVTAEYGSYLAKSVANCYGCHTDRDLMTGAFTGKEVAGGLFFEPDAFSQGWAFHVPNLTHHPSGIMYEWNEDAFVARLKAGRVHQGSPMPWGAISRMDEDDMRAVYRYLHAVEPVENVIEKTAYAPGEEYPKK